MSKIVPVWFDALYVGDVMADEDGTLGFTYTGRGG